MLPVVIIGADATVVDALHAWSSEDVPVLDFETAEEAQYALVEKWAGPGLLIDGERIPLQESDGRWRVSVVYGHVAAGLAATGQPERLAHAGWTIVAHHHLNDRPGAARRVADGRAVGSDPDTIIWQAAPVLGANFVLDVTNARATEFIRDQLAQRITP